MSREIKFRAWFKPYKGMCDWQYIQDTLNFYNIVVNDKYVIMQYTGIKDKNGVEIYEGDIVVRDGYPWFNDEKPNYRDTVEWVFAGFHTVHHCVNTEKHGISDGINEPLEDGHGWEVIGNIYENSELLKKGEL